MIDASSKQETGFADLGYSGRRLGGTDSYNLPMPMGGHRNLSRLVRAPSRAREVKIQLPSED